YTAARTRSCPSWSFPLGETEPSHRLADGQYTQKPIPFRLLSATHLSKANSLASMSWPSLRKCLRRKTILLEAAFFQNTGRCRVVGEDMGSDLHQTELLEGMLAYSLKNSGHDAPAPKRLRQPVVSLPPKNLENYPRDSRGTLAARPGRAAGKSSQRI